MALKKGYRLIALTLTNAFYVLEKDFAKFADFETELALIDVNDGYITLVTTYDGKYALIKNKRHVYYYGIEDRMEQTIKGDCVRCDTTPIALIPSNAAAYKKT